MSPSDEALMVRVVAEGVPTELRQVLNSPRLRYLFRAYLRSLYASESLLFYETVELYQTIDKETWRKRAAEGMIKKFVNPSSQYAVNISSKIREKLLNLRHFDRNSFDEAKEELYALMASNFFNRFISDNFEDGAATLAKHYESIRNTPRHDSDIAAVKLEV